MACLQPGREYQPGPGAREATQEWRCWNPHGDFWATVSKAGAQSNAAFLAPLKRLWQATGVDILTLSICWPLTVVLQIAFVALTILAQ